MNPRQIKKPELSDSNPEPSNSVKSLNEKKNKKIKSKLKLNGFLILYLPNDIREIIKKTNIPAEK